MARSLYVGADSVCFENITDAADGVNQFRLKGVVHLCAQPADNDIDNVGVGSSKSNVPDILCNFVTRYDFPDRANEMRERRNSFGVRFSGTPERVALWCRMSSSNRRYVNVLVVAEGRAATPSALAQVILKTRTVSPDSHLRRLKSFHQSEEHYPER